jgi:hypothetical protein
MKTIIGALIIAAAILTAGVIQSQTGRYQVEDIAGGTWIVLDTQTGHGRVITQSDEFGGYFFDYHSGRLTIEGRQ